MSDFLQFLIGGLVLGSMYAIIAMGFVLIYKSTTVLNFAQGEFLMVGAYVCLCLMVSYEIPFGWAFVLTLAVSALLGLATEALVLRPIAGEPIVSLIMATVGLSSILRGVVIAAWGNDARPFPEIFPSEPYLVAGVAVAPVYLWAVGASLSLMIVWSLFFKTTRTGLAMRAAASDRQAALSLGISLRRVFALAWGISAVVSSVGGVIIGVMNGVGISLAEFGLKIFPAVILGGLDSIVGAILGGLAVGILENLCGGYLDPFLPAAKQITPFLLLVLILMVRPYGLLGSREIERV